MKWDGTERDGIEWNGMRWDGMGWDVNVQLLCAVFSVPIATRRTVTLSVRVANRCTMTPTPGLRHVHLSVPILAHTRSLAGSVYVCCSCDL